MVLTSTHEKVFSAGGNLDQFAAEVPLVHKHFGTARFPQLFTLIGKLGKPVLCAANGHVLAGSLGIALACDLVIAREGATFGTPEINVGVFPFMIMALIYRNVPRKQASEMLLLGERLTRRGGARRRGSSTRSCRRTSSTPAVDEWAVKLASKSPVLMKLGKDAIYRQLDMPFEDALDYLRPALAGVLDRGHRRGRDGVLREARAAVEGPMSVSASTEAAPRRDARMSDGVSLVGLRCRTSERTDAPPRGVEALAQLLGKRLGREPRLIGTAGEPRDGRYDEDLRDSRGCLLEAGGQVDDALAGGRRAGAARRRVLDRRHHAADGRAHAPGGEDALARRSRRLQHARHDRERLSRRHGARRRLRAAGRRV